MEIKHLQLLWKDEFRCLFFDEKALFTMKAPLSSSIVHLSLFLPINSIAREFHSANFHNFNSIELQVIAFPYENMKRRCEFI